MKWIKLGCIFSPPKSGWMFSHAQNPFPESLGGGNFKIHFASRDHLNRSRGGFFIFHIEKPNEILDVSLIPTIELGPLGAFDDAGVMPSSIVNNGSSSLMFYTGWSRTVDVPFAFHIGMATSYNSDIFNRISNAPVLGRNYFDPYIVGSPYVLIENGIFRMWYVSCTKWIKNEEMVKARHYYTIKYAQSSDGIHWVCTSDLCLDYRENEYALARPVVWKSQYGYEMWFTVRGGLNTYRIASALSLDGVKWSRSDDSLNVDPTPGEWDAEMICYAHPIFYNDKHYMLYNGNDYGATGIGLAVLE